MKSVSSMGTILSQLLMMNKWTQITGKMMDIDIIQKISLSQSWICKLFWILKYIYQLICRDDKGFYSFEENDIYRNSALAGAVWISIALSIFVGILFTYFFVYYLNELFQFFLNESEHVKKYSSRHGKKTVDHVSFQKYCIN